MFNVRLLKFIERWSLMPAVYLTIMETWLIIMMYCQIKY